MMKNGGAQSAGVGWSAECEYENKLELGALSYVGARNVKKISLGARSANPKMGRSAERWKPPDSPRNSKKWKIFSSSSSHFFSFPLIRYTI